MNYYVPDFDMPDDQLLIPSSSTFTHHKEDEDEISELLWRDGQIVVQNHNQHRKFQSSTTATPVQNQFNNYQSSQQQQELHMAEDEMTTWLHYPIEDVYSDLTENQQTTNSLVRQSTVIPPTIPPPSTVALPQQPPMEIVANQNFQMFSRMRGKGPEATVVESNSITAQAAVMSAGEASSVFPSGFGDGNGNDKGRIMDRGGGSGEMTLSSSSGTSGGGWPANTCTAAAAALNTAALEEGGEKVEDRKRKQREIDRSTTAPPTSAAYQDVELDAANNTKKRPRGFHSKKTRAAEVHNLSERRRRDRINERMRALQELVPRCNKTDKASMLDEVIEYLKSLQMQVQMMSMGGGMVPMMYPGMQQQCMPPIMGMGIGMGMGMGMNRPMMPFPSNMPGSNFPASPAVGAGPQVGPNFNNQPVCMPSVPVAANYSANQGDSVRGSYPVQQTPGLAQHPNLGDPYQHYMALQQMQMQMQMQLQMQMQMQAVQNQSTSYRGSSKTGTEGQPGPSTSKTEGEDDQ